MTAEWKLELDREEQAIHHEQASNARKKARPPDTVLAEVHDRLIKSAKAAGYGDDIEAFIASLKVGNQKSQAEAKPKKPPSNSTRIQSKTTGTIFNTSKWNGLFNRSLRNELSKATQLTLPIASDNETG